MSDFFLRDVADNPAPGGGFADLIRFSRLTGAEGSPVWFLCGFKSDGAKHLERFTHAVMRGPSPLAPGMRELIAAFTSARNQCVY